MPEGSEGLPEGPKGLPERSKGLPEGSKGLSEATESLPKGPEGVLEGPYSLLVSQRACQGGLLDGCMYVQTERHTDEFLSLLPKNDNGCSLKQSMELSLDIDGR